MNVYALVFGLVLSILVVLWFRARRLERSKWAYPVLLATFPAYYWVFALCASDRTALRYELLVGLAFLAIAYVGNRVRTFATLLLLGIGYIAHGAYDLFHHELFINSGVPTWWPEFCGSVDATIGAYVVYFAFSTRSDAPQPQERS